MNQRTITEDDVGFMLAPRVNAASRMGDPRDAFQLFTTEDEAEAETLAKLLEKINRSRRAVAASITRAVHERMAEREGKFLRLLRWETLSGARDSWALSPTVWQKNMNAPYFCGT